MKKFVVLVSFVLFIGTADGQTLSGSFPDAGGPISVTATDGDVVAAGLDFLSASGGLIPAATSDAGPFTFFLANTANQVTYGNLGSTVTFANGSTTALSVGATAGASDITAAWGNGPTPVGFAVTGGGAAPPIIDPPVVVDPPVVDPPVVDPPVVIPPPTGGAISGVVRDGMIVVKATAPVAASGIDFISAGNFLVPVPDPPGSIPFTFFLSNTPGQITWGNLGSTVTLDGEWATQAGYTGSSPETELAAAWGKGPVPIPFAVTMDGAAPPVVDPPVVDPPVAPPAGGGPLVGEIRDGKVVLFASEALEVAGLDLISAGGNLVPVEGDDAAPFSFFLSNTPNQITWGNLGSTVLIDGEFATNAGYVGADPAGDLSAAWGNGPTPVAFVINAATPPVGNETIPEPTAGLLSVFAALGLLGFRRRRS